MGWGQTHICSHFVDFWDLVLIFIHQLSGKSWGSHTGRSGMSRTYLSSYSLDNGTRANLKDCTGQEAETDSQSHRGQLFLGPRNCCMRTVVGIGGGLSGLKPIGKLLVRPSEALSFLLLQFDFIKQET